MTGTKRSDFYYFPNMNKINITTTILVVFLFSCNSKNINKINHQWESLIMMHVTQYPDMQVDDIYKMVYQGIMGPGHLGSNPEKILEYINQEISRIESSQQENLIENISPDSEYVRINLKRFKSEQLSPDTLAVIIVKSGCNAPEKLKRFITIWSYVEELVEAERLPIDKTNFQIFNRFVVENNYPVIHHSKKYLQQYSPAYRVVSQKIWNQSFNRE